MVPSSLEVAAQGMQLLQGASGEHPRHWLGRCTASDKCLLPGLFIKLGGWFYSYVSD